MTRPMRNRKPETAKTGRRRHAPVLPWLAAAGGVLIVAAVAFTAVLFHRASHTAPRGGGADRAGLNIEPDERVFAAYAGSQSCRACHPDAYDAWSRSNHGRAERPLAAELDRGAFDPPRSFAYGRQTATARISGDRYELVATGSGGEPQPYAVERVIGNDPLRQFLVAAAGGRLQVLEASYDPHRDEWFGVYGDEDRQPGEWGHWTGRGMNWNSMCAACHNTRVRKNYRAADDTYRTTMAEATVACEACHGPMRQHVAWRTQHPDRARPDPTLHALTRDQVLDTCGSCHSRRGDLTGDFVPGDRYADHHLLVVLDETDLYYPDGQVRDEDYEFASFLSSRMHAAGVRCVDCHAAHSAKTPLDGNLLCMRCHNGGHPRSPVIDPASHSHHKVDGPGGQCVHCHMPQTTYMQRHARHDHGFTIPDPLLTKEDGIPNACNRCHNDKDADWALRAVAEWYGVRMERATRTRAQLFARARRGDEAARDPLLTLLDGGDTPYWKAAAVRLLGAWVQDSKVTRALLGELVDDSPLVRTAAVHALAPLAAANDADTFAALERMLDDPARSVRVSAAGALRATVDPQSEVDAEMRHALELNADQPIGQLQIAGYRLARQDTRGALEHLRKAVAWDPNSAPLREELAVVLSMLGQSRESLEQIQVACRLEPGVAEHHYRLGLAWNELGELPRTIHSLVDALRLDPRHARAWYNLGLAYDQAGRTEQALEALARGEAADPRDHRLPYARATILLRQGRTGDARAAASRVLELRPDSDEARALRGALP